MNVLKKLIWKTPEETDEVIIFPCENLVEYIKASAPLFTLTSYRRLFKNSHASENASFTMHVSISFFNISLKVIKQKLPKFLKNVDNNSLHRICWTKLGSSPGQLLFKILDSSLKAFYGWSEAGHCASCKICFWTHFWNLLLLNSKLLLSSAVP